MNHKITPMTEDVRKLIAEKTEASKQYALDNLKTVYAEDKYWRILASQYNVKLPRWWMASTELKYMKRISKKLNFDIQSFVDSTGCSSLRELASINPKYTAFAMCGLLLEWWHENISETSDAYIN